jgi:hypothetical protein
MNPDFSEKVRVRVCVGCLSVCVWWGRGLCVREIWCLCVRGADSGGRMCVCRVGKGEEMRSEGEGRCACVCVGCGVSVVWCGVECVCVGWRGQCVC